MRMRKWISTRCVLVLLFLFTALQGPSEVIAQFGPGGFPEDKHPETRAEFEQARKKKANRLLAIQKTLEGIPVGSPGRAELRVQYAQTAWELSDLCTEESLLDEFFDVALKAAEGKDVARIDELRKQYNELNQRSAEWTRKAIEELEAVVAEAPEYEKLDEVLFHLGYYLVASGAEESGAEWMQKLINGYPESAYLPEAYLLLGEYSFERQRLESAVAFYQKVIDLGESTVLLYARYKLAWCDYNLQDFAKSLSGFVAVVKAANESEHWPQLGKEALRDLLLAYSEVGKPKEALAFFQDLCSERTEEMGAGLARLYTDQGKYKNSVRMLEALLQEFPGSANTVAYHVDWVRNVFFLGSTEEVMSRAKALAEVVLAKRKAGQADAGSEREAEVLLDDLSSHYYQMTSKGTPAVLEASQELSKLKTMLFPE